MALVDTKLNDLIYTAKSAYKNMVDKIVDMNNELSKDVSYNTSCVNKTTSDINTMNYYITFLLKQNTIKDNLIDELRDEIYKIQDKFEKYTENND